VWIAHRCRRSPIQTRAAALPTAESAAKLAAASDLLSAHRRARPPCFPSLPHTLNPPPTTPYSSSSDTPLTTIPSPPPCLSGTPPPLPVAHVRTSPVPRVTAYLLPAPRPAPLPPFCRSPALPRVPGPNRPPARCFPRDVEPCGEYCDPDEGQEAGEKVIAAGTECSPQRPCPKGKERSPHRVG